MKLFWIKIIILKGLHQYNTKDQFKVNFVMYSPHAVTSSEFSQFTKSNDIKHM